MSCPLCNLWKQKCHLFIRIPFCFQTCKNSSKLAQTQPLFIPLYILVGIASYIDKVDGRVGSGRHSSDLHHEHHQQRVNRHGEQVHVSSVRFQLSCNSHATALRVHLVSPRRVRVKIDLVLFLWSLHECLQFGSSSCGGMRSL